MNSAQQLGVSLEDVDVIRGEVINVQPEPQSDLSARALTWPEKAKAVQIADQQSYDHAAEMLKGIAELRKEIEAHHGPLKAKAHEAHKAIVAAENRLLEPLKQAEITLKNVLGSWAREQERKRQEEERRLREEQERLLLEAREKEIEEAEAAGAGAEEVGAIIEQPIVAPRTVVQPSYQAARGITTRENWRAEIVDIRKLARAVADGVCPVTLIEANMVALNGMARSLKTALVIPGVRAVKDEGVSVRTR